MAEWQGEGAESPDDCEPLVMVRFELRGGPLDGETGAMPDECESILVVKVAPTAEYRIYGDDPRKIPRQWCVGFYGYVAMVGPVPDVRPLHWRDDELPDGITDDDFRQPSRPSSNE